MGIYYNLGVKTAATGRRSVSTKLKTKADERTKQRALNQPAGNQQDPFRYGQKVNKRSVLPKADGAAGIEGGVSGN